MSLNKLTAPDYIREKFNFSVDKFPLSGPDNLSTPCYGLFRSDNMEFVGGSGNAVSRGYVPHQTDDVIALAEAACHAFECDMDVEATFNKGHIVTLAPTAEIRKAVYGQRDNVFARIHLSFGYEKTSCKAALGYFRDACSNLSMPRMVEGCTRNIRHQSNLRDHMDELITNFQGLKEGWATLSEVVENMQNAEVRLSEFLTAIYGSRPVETGRGQTIHDNITRKIATRILHERTVTGRPSPSEDTVSVWEAYNGVQGFVQHQKSRRGTLTEYQRAIAASNDNEVISAEQLSMSLIA